MLCTNCNTKYFSNILKENENAKILPATWKKYHCSTLINAIMKCVKCKSSTNIYKTSDYLIIILNYKKINKKINIVYDEYIDIKNYIEEYNTSKYRNYKDYCYRLVGIVLHSGDSSSYGHYISCCRNTNNENNKNTIEEIYLFSDSYVRTLNFSQIKKYNCSPYILFYEKYYDYKNNFKKYYRK